MTLSAGRSLIKQFDDAVVESAHLLSEGWSWHAIRAQSAARRWQRFGRVIVRHNGTLTTDEIIRVVLLNQGPRAVTTSFTGAAQWGLTGWERAPVHLLVPRGARVRRIAGVAIRVHYVRDWSMVDANPARRIDAFPHAVVLASASSSSPRAACGILAAAVQQRLTDASTLHRTLDRMPRTRHRAVLLRALDDIGQGAQALSEIDFVRLCRRYRLPEPVLQAVRIGPGGRRRYLDAEWMRADGRRVVAEVDGAIHLRVQNWVDDQLRQNEVSLTGSIVLRFPSVVVRTEPERVAAQLRVALLVP